MHAPMLTVVFGLFAIVTQVLASALPRSLAIPRSLLSRRQDSLEDCEAPCEPWNKVYDECLAQETPTCFCDADNSPIFDTCAECQMAVWAKTYPGDPQFLEDLAVGFEDGYGVWVMWCEETQGKTIPDITITRTWVVPDDAA